MPFITQGKTNFPYLLLIVAIAIVAGGFILTYYYLWIIDLESRLVDIEIKLPPKTIEDETANWKTYRNEEYGLEIKYPSIWESNTGPLPHVFLFGPSGWPTDSQVNIWVTPESNLDGFYENKTEMCKKDLLANKEAYKCEGDNYVYIETENKGKFYFLSIKGDKSSGKFETFNQMLSTFKFIETK